MSVIRSLPFFLLFCCVYTAVSITAAPGLGGNILPGDIFDNILGELEDALKNKVDMQKKWRKYLEDIRAEAKEEHAAALDFITHADFYVTIKKTTFIKKSGGFKHVPLCILLPVREKKVLVGGEVCTTPSFSRLKPAGEFICSLQKKLETMSDDKTMYLRHLGELNEKHTGLVDLITKVAASLQDKHDEEGKPVNEHQLETLLQMYNRQIRDINREIKQQEKSLNQLKTQEKFLTTVYATVTAQMKYYRLPVPGEESSDEKEKNIPTIEKLRELNKMLKEGLINQSDYDKAKERLLKKM